MLYAGELPTWTRGSGGRRQARPRHGHRRVREHGAATAVLVAARGRAVLQASMEAGPTMGEQATGERAMSG